MSDHNIYVPGKGVHVMAERCATCIFRPGNLMHLEPGRVKEMVKSATEDPDAGTIVCHDTLDTEQNAVCRGFYERHQPAALQIAERLGMLVEHRP